ncbi:Alkaline shock protein 23 [bacterium HR07]|uniref:Alkaline shock protein n=1 Tax=Acetithermum autotrophicum TaxID=1446466 RepID=H5SRF6_ACEAU|nr:alkaline shock protein [Candidatus Acetothermum autotrophicum]GBC75997.1 Alkaline shock protein 23 [bacterium HR07]
MASERKAAKRVPWRGHVSIAEEVVSSIASIAAQEVEGLSGLKGTVADGLAALLSGEKRRGVAAQLSEDQSIRIRLKAVIRYGYPIHEVAQKVQAKVKQEIEGMTGLRVSAVDVYVQELDLGEPGVPRAPGLRTKEES